MQYCSALSSWIQNSASSTILINSEWFNVSIQYNNYVELQLFGMGVNNTFIIHVYIQRYNNSGNVV